MVRYFKGSVKFNEGSRILTQYKSTLPHPHCNTNTHINNVSAETIGHLETDDIEYLLSFVNGRPTEGTLKGSKVEAQKKAREFKRQLYYDLVNDYGVCNDIDLPFIEWVEKYRYNQYCILYKKSKS